MPMALGLFMLRRSRGRIVARRGEEDLGLIIRTFDDQDKTCGEMTRKKECNFSQKIGLGGYAGEACYRRIL